MASLVILLVICTLVVEASLLLAVSLVALNTMALAKHTEALVMRSCYHLQPRRFQSTNLAEQ
jgi:hypothetical protein